MVNNFVWETKMNKKKKKNRNKKDIKMKGFFFHMPLMYAILSKFPAF